MPDKKWVHFKLCDKVIVNICVEHFYECWKRVCAELHDLESQKKVFQDEELAIIEEASKDEVEGLRRCAEVRSMNVNEALAE